MKKISHLLACLVLIACYQPASSKKKRVTERPSPGQEMLAETQVVFGDEATLANFPATCGFDRSCTCVLVGPEALVTAAHCVSRAPGKNTGDGEITTFGQGERHAECLVDAGLDLAVCRVRPEVGNIAFERLSTTPLALTSRLLLTGFGLTETGVRTGRLHKGIPVITDLPRANSNLIRISMAEGAHLDRGDSGGPAYLLLAEGENEMVPRLVAGINSNHLDVTSVSTSAANEFICGWADDNAPICGCPTEPESGCR